MILNNDVEGSDFSLFRHLPGETEKYHENLQSEYSVSWQRFESKTEELLASEEKLFTTELVD
jgi:hypothetical protein